jgi:hypothetical protein
MHPINASKQNAGQVQVKCITLKKYLEIQYSYRNISQENTHYNWPNHIRNNIINYSLAIVL